MCGAGEVNQTGFLGWLAWWLETQVDEMDLGETIYLALKFCSVLGRLSGRITSVHSFSMTVGANGFTPREIGLMGRFSVLVPRSLLSSFYV